MKIALAHGTAQLEKLRRGGWYLHSIIVDDAYRGQGIGSRIMKKILLTCEPPIFLLATGELGGDPARLVHFYESFGFKKTKQSPHEGVGYNYNMVHC